MNKKKIPLIVISVLVIVVASLLMFNALVARKTLLHCAYSTQDGFWNSHKEILIKPDEKLDIGVTLVADDGAPLPGKRVVFLQWRKGIFFSTALTTESGVASVSYKAPASAALNSTGTLYAFYAGNFIYQSHACTVPVKVVNDRFEYSTTAPEGKSVFQNIGGGYVAYVPQQWGVVHRIDSLHVNFGPGVRTDHGLGGIEVFDDQVSVDDFFKHPSRADGTYVNLRPTVVGGNTAVRYNRLDPVLGGGVVTLKRGRLYHLYIHSQDEKDLENFDYLAASFQFIKPIH